MATSIDELKRFLDEYELVYHVDEERSVILIAFGHAAEKSAYRDEIGEPCVRIVIQVLEDGQFVSVFSPNAWNIDDCQYKPAVFEALASIQTQYKMLRFDYDPADGELRPNIELPLEDAEITSRQFHRLLHGIIESVQRYDALIRHAMQTGEVSFALLHDAQRPDSETAELRRLLALADRAGGIEALEHLVAGAGAPDVDERSNDSISDELLDELLGDTPPDGPDEPGDQRKAG